MFEVKAWKFQHLLRIIGEVKILVQELKEKTILDLWVTAMNVGRRVCGSGLKIFTFICSSVKQWWRRKCRNVPSEEASFRQANITQDTTIVKPNPTRPKWS